MQEDEKYGENIIREEINCGRVFIHGGNVNGMYVSIRYCRFVGQTRTPDRGNFARIKFRAQSS